MDNIQPLHDELSDIILFAGPLIHFHFQTMLDNECRFIISRQRYISIVQRSLQWKRKKSVKGIDRRIDVLLLSELSRFSCFARARLRSNSNQSGIIAVVLRLSYCSFIDAQESIVILAALCYRANGEEISCGSFLYCCCCCCNYKRAVRRKKDAKRDYAQTRFFAPLDRR